MSRKFKLEKDYYENGYDIYSKRTITINEGVTVLVGCNGAGKTTLLHQIKHQLKEKGIPVVSFDNLSDGGKNALSSAGFYGDFQYMAASMTSSEGENIVMCLKNFASSLREFIKTGIDSSKSSKMSRAFAEIFAKTEPKEEKEIPNERWILFDAIDSGLSVDNICDVKEYLFKTILEDSQECSVYIVVSANEYEMARNSNCFDVQNGRYVNIRSYERYRNLILKSRELKEKQINQKASEEND